MACQAPSSGWLEETMEEFRTSAVANSYVAVTNLAFDSVNDARAKCRDACDAVEKCKGFYFQGRTDDKEQNICNLYSTCEIRKQNWAVGSLYTPIDETANCCKPLTICTDKQYETKSAPTDGTATSNRQCQDYTTSCTGDQYLDTSTKSRTTDATCTPWSTCTSDQYESKAPSGTSDRECTTLRKCSDTEFQTKAPTTTSDRKCSPLTKCTEMQYESKASTSTSDRICTPYTTSCGADQYLDESTKSRTTDSTCRNLTQCTDSQFESVKPTATSNRQCQAYKKSCPEGQWLDFGTPTEDRECKDYTTSCTGSFYLDESTKSSTADATCLPKKSHGSKCTDGNMCVSGNCINGTCVCKEGHYCPGLQGAFQAIIDEPEPTLLGFNDKCTSDDQCASGNCNNNVCCNKDLDDANCAACGYTGYCTKCKPSHKWNMGRCSPKRRPKVVPAQPTANQPKSNIVRSRSPNRAGRSRR